MHLSLFFSRAAHASAIASSEASSGAAGDPRAPEDEPELPAAAESGMYRRSQGCLANRFGGGAVRVVEEAVVRAAGSGRGGNLKNAFRKA